MSVILVVVRTLRPSSTSSHALFSSGFASGKYENHNQNQNIQCTQYYKGTLHPSSASCCALLGSGVLRNVTSGKYKNNNENENQNIQCNRLLSHNEPPKMNNNENENQNQNIQCNRLLSHNEPPKIMLAFL
jgi:hypothetical protein